MKNIESPPLTRINAFLDHVDAGEYIVYGELEAYSCKLAGLDKKLSRSLDKDVTTGSSPHELSMSPVGPLAESSSRKTLIYLILTLNHIYPDYDFTLLRAQNFSKQHGLAAAEAEIDSHLLEVSKVWDKSPGCSEPFLDCLWTALDEAVDIKNCDVYSYKTDGETDPFGEQATVWCFNYFFYNKKKKVIVYFSCKAVSKNCADQQGTEDTSKYAFYNSDDEDNAETATDYGMANEMDDI